MYQQYTCIKPEIPWSVTARCWQTAMYWSSGFPAQILLLSSLCTTICTDSAFVNSRGRSLSSGQLCDDSLCSLKNNVHFNEESVRSVSSTTTYIWGYTFIRQRTRGLGEKTIQGEGRGFKESWLASPIELTLESSMVNETVENWVGTMRFEADWEEPESEQSRLGREGCVEERMEVESDLCCRDPSSVKSVKLQY